jgi:hypothetical protein
VGVLSEMLNALEPAKKGVSNYSNSASIMCLYNLMKYKDFRVKFSLSCNFSESFFLLLMQAVSQEVIVDLVEKCRTNKDQVVKLVASTT